MGKRRKSKAPRGSQGARHAPCLQDRVKRQYLDLCVELPPQSPAAEVQVESQLLVRRVLERLADTGYSTAALTHTVYGRPPLDPISHLFPWEENASNNERRTKRLKADANKHKINILKRLHAVVENLSDVAAYTLQTASDTTTDASQNTFENYDIVSISPRNDATFQAACASATATDIVTLDYTAGRGGIQLPFKIRSADVKALVARGAAVELPYAPALLHVNKRKALVQAARELQMASVGVRPKPRLLLSSGSRIFGDKDIGAMALRTPGDLINLMQAVLRFDPTTSYNALSATGADVVRDVEKRRLGRPIAGELTVEILERKEEDSENDQECDIGKPDEQKEEVNKEEPLAKEKDEKGAGIDDGFIVLS